MQPKYYGAVADYNRNKRGGFHIDRRLAVIIGGGAGALLIIAIGFAILNVAASGPKDDLARLVAREQLLGKFLKDNQQFVQNSDLIKITAESSLLLSTDQQTLTHTLSAIYGVGAVPDGIAQSEADTTSADALKTAAAAGTFDHIYTSLITDKLTAAQTLAAKVQTEVSADAQHDVAQAIKTLQTINGQLGKLQL